MPNLLPDRNPPFNIYFAISVMIILISSNELNPTLVMEQLSSYNSTIDETQIADRLLDETGSFIITNTRCFSILVAYKIIQYLVLGTLRVSEQQRLRETFWDYFLQKSIFVVFILDVKNHHDRLPWPIWFTALGSILLLSKLCKDRFEYLSSSPAAKNWSLIKIGLLMSLLLILTIFCSAFASAKPFTTETLFLLADATYVLTFVISVIIRFIVLTYDMRSNSVWENRASIIYYSDLLFATSMLSIDLLHHLHLLVISHTSVLIKGWCLIRIHTLVTEIRKRYKRHKNYLLIVQLLESNFSMASQEDIDKNSDDCAICWDVLDSARKLPCGHLFHNSCLRSWLEQDTSCPTCRTSLKGSARSSNQSGDLVDEIEDQSESDEETNYIEGIRAHPEMRSHFFHFDSSRYTNNPFLSWLPTISIEGFM